MGVMPGLKAFVAAVLGGIGNIPGAALGGLLLGVVETFVNGSQWSTYKDAIAFAVLIIILLFRPAGLAAASSGRRKESEANPVAAAKLPAQPPTRPLAAHSPRPACRACWPTSGLSCFPGRLRPLLTSSVHAFIGIGINIILAVSLNLVNGYTGQFSLGHAGFMSVGAYLAAAVSLFLGPRLLGEEGGTAPRQKACCSSTALARGAVCGAALAGLLVGYPFPAPEGRLPRARHSRVSARSSA